MSRTGKADPTQIHATIVRDSDGDGISQFYVKGYRDVSAFQSKWKKVVSTCNITNNNLPLFIELFLDILLRKLDI